MILKHKAELAGRVKLKISGGARGEIDIPWFNNMILDQGLRKLLTASSTNVHEHALSYTRVGSSSAPVSPTDVDVLSFVAESGIAGSYPSGWDSDGEFGWTRATTTYPRGMAAGNLSEITTGNTGANNAYARALIKDAEGNPTTITVLSDEVLTVTWEIRRWWSVMPDHSITYDDDGTPATTTVSYTPLSSMAKTSSVLGTAGAKGWNASLVSDFTAEKVVGYSETQGNPSIGKASPPDDYMANAFPKQTDYATFSPPISKTNEFTVAIVWQLTLARREP